MTVQAGAGEVGFYITYIQGRFRIYCKAALCWGVGAKGEVGFEVDGSSFAAFMKSFMFMLRNVDYQKIELMMEEMPSVLYVQFLLLWRHKGYRQLMRCTSM